MKKVYVTAILALAVLFFAITWHSVVQEGFQTLPTGAVTITGFAIYSDLNTIMAKLPFLHTSFTEIKQFDTSALSGAVNSLTGSGTTFRSLTNLVSADNVPRLLAFNLKAAIIGTLTQTEIDTLNNASQSLFGATGKIAYMTSTGSLFPSIQLPVTTPPPSTPPADGYYKDATSNLYYIKTVSGTTTYYQIATGFTCGTKTIPALTDTTVGTVTATQLSGFTAGAALSATTCLTILP